MCQFFPQHSIFCIVPPHVLRRIAQNGTAEQRAAANRSLAIDDTMRAMRAARRPDLIPAMPPTVTAGIAQKQRTIFTANNTQSLPGNQVRIEGQSPSGDLAIDEAYDGLGDTYDFYFNKYGRNSIDDEGSPLRATCHFDVQYNNAFWNGEQMVFGDGDGLLFNRFTISLDVIGHELAHGVTEDEAGLLYFFQSGALNESMSDVFGSLIKQVKLNQTAAEADWLIGAGLFTANVNGTALRSMKDPGSAFDDPVLGKDPQPAHMSDFVDTYEDNGGVHINSGIPNKAFYLAATKLGGYAWERAGRIWYDALRDSAIRPNTGFRRFARVTIAHAAAMGAVEADAVREAWAEVGISVAAPTLAPLTMRAGTGATRG
jgi:Zn-dependent metalloprotease